MESILGDVPNMEEGPERKMLLLRKVMRQLLAALKSCHSTGAPMGLCPPPPPPINQCYLSDGL